MHSLLCLILYAAWLSLLCNLDFSCFKSLYYVPFALVVLVCCSLPPLERERLKYMSKTSYRQIVSRLPFAYTYTHPINTTNRGGRYNNSEWLFERITQVTNLTNVFVKFVLWLRLELDYS